MTITTTPSAKYAAQARRANAMIAKRGATVTFYADVARGGTLATDVTVNAVEIPGDPDTYTALNIVVANPVTLLVAALSLGVAITPGMQFRWGGELYDVKLATPLSPDAGPIIWTVVGVA